MGGEPYKLMRLRLIGNFNKIKTSRYNNMIEGVTRLSVLTPSILPSN